MKGWQKHLRGLKTTCKAIQNKYYIAILLALFLSIAIGVYYCVPIGADVHYHLTIANAWAHGDLSSLIQDRLIYPPLLHFIFVPSVWFGVQIPFAVFLQIIFLPVAVFSISKNFKGFSFLLIGVVVLGSYAFVDRIGQVNPQALDFILFPLAIYYSQVNVSDKKFIAVATLMFWNHSFVALACLGGIFVSMLHKRHWKPLVWILLFSSPIIIASILFLPSIFNLYQVGVYENAQEAQFWASPLWWTLLYQRLPFIGFFLIAYKLFAKKMTQLDRASFLSLCSLSLLIIPWADRFIQYSTIPLSIIIVTTLEQLKNRKTELSHWLVRYAYLIIFSIFILFYLSRWLWLFAGGYHVIQ